MRRVRSPWTYARRVVSLVWGHPSNRGKRLEAVARSLGWQLYKRIIGRPLDVTVLGGVRIRCYPDSGYASNLFYFTAWRDWSELSFMQHYLRPGDRFIDGGANIGLYSLFAAHLVGPGGRVKAFEPFPLSADRLRENVALNGFTNVDVYEAALFDRSGSVTILADVDVSNRIVQEIAPDRRTLEVRSCRLDEIGGDGPYAMGKLDIEGAEMHALAGAETMLSACDPPVWQLELADGLLRKSGSSRQELVDYVRSRGFELALYDPDARRLDYSEARWGGSLNVLAIAHQRREMVEDRLRSGRPNAYSGRS